MYPKDHSRASYPTGQFILKEFSWPTYLKDNSSNKFNQKTNLLKDKSIKGLLIGDISSKGLQSTRRSHHKDYNLEGKLIIRTTIKKDIS